MNRVEFLRQQVTQVEDLLSNPADLEMVSDSEIISNRARDLSMATFRQHLADLRDQLRQELLIRQKEVVEVCLGETLDPGTIKLNLLGRVSKHFSSAVEHAARFVQRGTHRGPMPNDIINTMDLRLAVLAGGSTRLLVTGNTAPDLFGRSILEESLKEAFAILTAEDADHLTEAVALIGSTGARAIKDLLHDVANAGLPLTIRWETPEEAELIFSGVPEQLYELAQSLDAFAEMPPVDVPIVGRIITVSLREPFEIESDDGEIYSAVVPGDLLVTMETVNVGKRATAMLHKNILHNRVTGAEKITYVLKQLTPL
jgi:hypothetical protein